jgi:hypothetical protein
VWLPHGPVGQVESVEGIDEARVAPGVHTCSVSVSAGGEITELRSSWDRIALITAEGATPAEALANAQNAANLIKVNIKR